MNTRRENLFNPLTGVIVCRVPDDLQTARQTKERHDVLLPRWTLKQGYLHYRDMPLPQLLELPGGADRDAGAPLQSAGQK